MSPILWLGLLLLIHLSASPNRMPQWISLLPNLVLIYSSITPTFVSSYFRTSKYLLQRLPGFVMLNIFCPHHLSLAILTFYPSGLTWTLLWIYIFSRPILANLVVPSDNFHILSSANPSAVSLGCAIHRYYHACAIIFQCHCSYHRWLILQQSVRTSVVFPSVLMPLRLNGKNYFLMKKNLNLKWGKHLNIGERLSCVAIYLLVLFCRPIHLWLTPIG